MPRKKLLAVAAGAAILLEIASSARAAYRFKDFRGRPPIHIFGGAASAPQGLAPSQIKAVYRLPAAGGHGVIAIVGAYDDPTVEKDLNVFSAQFGLPPCTTKNGCFLKHRMGAGMSTNSGWSLEASLDTQWSHAIAPDAKILLVEAKTPSGKNLLAAVDYARKRAGVVAVSMSWGGAEFEEEVSLDNHFSNSSGITFFASSGDNGAGASWPAVSANVVAVGGTKINFRSDGMFSSEKAWTGSGGGVSAYEPQPAYQAAYSIPKANGKRAIPDVSYNADPQSGFSVYRGKWYVLGGTSAGAPQWAAIKSLGLSAGNEKFYGDKAGTNHTSFFRDITSGANGACAYYCEARKHYDYVTGLGSPLTIRF